MPRFIDPSQRYSGGGIIDPSPRGSSTIGRAGALEALLSMFDENSADAMRLAQGGMDPATLAQILANRQGLDTQERMTRQQGNQAYIAQLQQAIARGKQAQADRALQEQMQARQLGASERTAGQNLAAQQAQLKAQQDAARNKQAMAGQRWSADYQRKLQRDQMQRAIQERELALKEKALEANQPGKEAPLGAKDRSLQIQRALRSYERQAQLVANNFTLQKEERQAQLDALTPNITALRKELLRLGLPPQPQEAQATPEMQSGATPEAQDVSDDLVNMARERAWAAMQDPNNRALQEARKNFPNEPGQQFTWMMSEIIRMVLAQNGQ